ncbi:peptidylprolyl isomerase/peptidyl-prolyl cis-trans isomerase C [Bartonella sp. CDC_skunk]|uniref:Parvulin-like PPIase n=1 Tax=Bartonella rochalimae ATCC BAA-1498 TaxID=685782 RepID=A0A067WHH7_9HYPH|nr:MULTISPECIES: peptidylprolyl isomerase [Bartonella]AQX18056.1 peptidylprolyl isomerase/peptidyl-prolyl cis-trans isomerase C [Bartonella sp. A1379B]AQX20988.1 peptidylprolyl isomerase/peptidyl-prolyl cis-trans isomerase C [Bartonella sp. CDC_skunk]AQX22571.1 peptidylprolyl isomerase/peptidyl-prolyl cis-trans isomerase C [Bartonella sp. 11B]AQX24148.1 peptidylprolyl isomerase/peptidyl-prolyl cis-trans isomerase C [Bartonella sp. 114]AQX25020.1 peptidylprolyl isomerase/peptidyl-prolyl cis-tra
MRFNFRVLCLASTLLVGIHAGVIAQESVKSAKNDLSTLENAAEKPVPLSHVIAVIDGKNITAGQLDELALEINPNLVRVPDEKRRVTVLKAYLDMQALAKAALQKGLDKTEAYDKRMAIMRDNILQQLYFKEMVVDKIADADVKALYDKEIAALPKEDEIKARHILVKTKEEAEKVIKRLNKGESFEEIAKKDSTDGSSAVGGDLGYFSRGQMVKPFEEAAFNLKVGEYTKKPVESPFGWHVIKIEDRRLKQPPVFDDVKDVLRTQLIREHYQTLITDLRGKINVEYPDSNIAKHMQSLNENEAPFLGETSNVEGGE